MLVENGGISRNIDEKRLGEYESKGFKPVDKSGKTNAPNITVEKPIEKMNTAELIAKAAELGIDISGENTNKQRAEMIISHIANG